MAWKASGSTNLELGKREREWDADAARERIFRWAGWEDKPSPAKAKRAFFAYDADEPTNLTAYKFAFADVVGGELKAMPRGLFAVAQVLQGARHGVDLPDSVLRSVRHKVTAYYHKMNEEPPWEEQHTKGIPGKITPAERRRFRKSAAQAARTRARRGTHGTKKMTPTEHKKRVRGAHTAAHTRASNA
jgi:hypothetical protein